MITLNQVKAGYDGSDVLKGITFDIPDGDSLCIIGPNGCGKTTLLRAIAGILPFTGEILLDGQPVKHIKRKLLAKKVGMLSQITQVYFNYTVYDTVMMGRYIHETGILGGVSDTDRQVVESVLETVGMLDLKDREIDTLSGGQLQRVFLAKVLVQDPEIILLDEPTNHLDLSYQIELIRFLRDWSKEKKRSVIGVIHDINLAMLLSDNILLMEDGYIRAHGRCDEVLASKALSEAYKIDIAAYMLHTLQRWDNIINPKEPAYE